MAKTMHENQVISFEELLMSQVVSQEAIIRLLVEKRIFAKEEFLGMVKAVNLEILREKHACLSRGDFSYYPQKSNR